MIIKHRLARSIQRESNLRPEQFLVAQLFDSGFPEGDSNYNCCQVGSDGRIYFSISSHHPNQHARLFCLDPSGDNLEFLTDVGSPSANADKSSLGQGKIHVNLFESGGKFYMATHRSIKPGGSPYVGGHFLEYEICSGKLRVIGAAPPEEGIISMAADYYRARLYGLTWPSGHLLTCDLTTGVTTSIARVFGKGEQGTIRMPGSSPICRSLALEPRHGAIYWANSRGQIKSYSFGSDCVEKLAGCRLSHDGFRRPDIWRQTFWHPTEKVFYGVQHRRSVLFRFDPYHKKVNFIDYIPAEPYRYKKAACEPMATLALRLATDGETLYYIATAPAMITCQNRYVRRTLHFITYHLPSRKYRDWGVLRLRDGRYPVYCQSMAVHNGMAYAICWIELPPGVNKGDNSEAIRKARNSYASAESERFVEEVNLIRFSVPK